MRWLSLMLLAGCAAQHEGHPLPTMCPTSEADGGALDGTSCAVPIDQMCFVLNEFSSCNSDYYRCIDGIWSNPGVLQVADGQSCTGAPLTSCSYEGNPGCDANPTSESCDCGSDGKWHCDCACYGTETTCDVQCPDDFPGVGSGGPMCSDVGSTCSYPGHTCTCASTGQFSCT